jgi:dolichyl-phosphate beta-glucosyltransferase
MAGEPVTVPLATDLSIVLPCYRAAALARRSVREAAEALERSGLSFEIVVVDDGGGDFTIDEWTDGDPVRLVRLERNRGKGAAVRAGMLAARGRARIFTDVDLPFGTDLFPVITEYLLSRDYHVVIGDRTLPGAEYRLRLSWRRRAASAAFTGFVGTLVTGGFFDTQCGLKGVRGDVADALFPLLRVDRFAFDVELVYVALKHRLDIKRIPVRLLHNDTSSVRLLRDSARGFVDVFRVKYHQLRGWYDSPPLDDIVRRDFAAMQAASADSAVRA